MGTKLWDLEGYLLRIYAVRHNLADLTTDWLGIRMGVFRPQINPPDYQMEKTNPPDYQIEQKNPPDYQMEQKIHLIIKWNRQVQVVPQIICHRSHLFQNFTDDCWSWKWGWHSL